VKQKIAGHREFEIEGGLLKDDAQHGQGRDRIAQHVPSHYLDAAGPTSTAVADFFFADSGSGRTMELGPLERSIIAPPGETTFQ
jgi:hypothetical protein